MDILPTTASFTNQDVSPRTPSSLSHRLPVMFRRLHRFQQMDFELAAWQLTYLCLAPKRVLTETKNTWARDDPAIIILICACLSVAAIIWSVVYSYTVIEGVWLIFLMTFRDFVLVGTVVATTLWCVLTAFMQRGQVVEH